MQGNAVREAPVAGGAHIGAGHHRRGVIVATVAALLMTFFGAFGTDALPLGKRLGYWLVLMEAGALIGIGAATGVRGWGRLAARPVLEGGAISLIIALPLTLVALGAAAIFFPPRAFSVQHAALMFVAVFVVTAAITAVNYLTGQAKAAPAPVTAEAVPVLEAPQRLLDRLPAHLRRGQVIALEAEDHYVRVHMSGGSDLVLLRLGDAMAELDGLAGSRTHRSWWVARNAVASARKGDGKGELTLVNGTVVPVSRSALPLLQKDGWFEERRGG